MSDFKQQDCFKEAVWVQTQRIYDSCSDKDYACYRRNIIDTQVDTKKEPTYAAPFYINYLHKYRNI